MTDPLFAAPDADDATLAAIVGERLGCTLPAECVPGVAANARILQAHADTLAGGA